MAYSIPKRDREAVISAMYSQPASGLGVAQDIRDRQIRGWHDLLSGKWTFTIDIVRNHQGQNVYGVDKDPAKALAELFSAIGILKSGPPGR